MAIRSLAARIACSRTSTKMEGFGIGGGRMSRYFSDGKGKILSKEERAKENVYIQKMERERMDKLKKKMEKEKAAAAASEKGSGESKKAEEPHKSKHDGMTS